ncbi:MAG: hypothetical protein AVO33_05720 [delta proteobacterium ML8_F1]|nr:MAG: hypothetical protein AVO33_05720 [delta proteobacterium ML8_F1]
MIEALLIVTVMLVIVAGVLQKIVDFETISKNYFNGEVMDYAACLEKSFRRILVEKLFLDAF